MAFISEVNIQAFASSCLQVTTRKTHYHHSHRLQAHVYVQSITSLAEHQPDSRKQDINGFTKHALYQEGLMMYPNDFCSASTFYRVLNEDFSDLRIPKKTRFSVCDICVRLKEAISTARTPPDKEKFKELRSQHVQEQKKERIYYHQKIQASQEDPNNATSIIIDAMDQTKTSAPGFNPKPKKLSEYQLKTHLTGSKVRLHEFGKTGQRSWCFVARFMAETFQFSSITTRSLTTQT